MSDHKEPCVCWHPTLWCWHLWDMKETDDYLPAMIEHGLAKPVTTEGEVLYREEPRHYDGHWHDLEKTCRCGLLVEEKYVVQVYPKEVDDEDRIPPVCHAGNR